MQNYGVNLYNRLPNDIRITNRPNADQLKIVVKKRYN